MAKKLQFSQIFALHKTLVFSSFLNDLFVYAVMNHKMEIVVI